MPFAMFACILDSPSEQSQLQNHLFCGNALPTQLSIYEVRSYCFVDLMVEKFSWVYSYAVDDLNDLYLC